MWRILTSSKLALWLIALMAVEMGIAMFIPQTDFFTSPIFILTITLFWLNTFCCTYAQARRAWDNFYYPHKKGREIAITKVEKLNYKEFAKTLKGVLARHRFKTKFGQDKNQILMVSERFRWGLWGMVIFHIAILWTILGAVWGVVNKVEGNAFVVEGFSIKELHQDYANLNEGLIFNEKHAGFEVKIHKVNLKYSGKLAPKLESVQLSINEGGQVVLNNTLELNQLLEYQGYKIKVNRRGFAPIIQVDNGGIPGYNLISLDVHQEPNGGESYGQTTFIKDLQKELELVFYPSPPDANKRNIDYRINNPQLQLTYTDEQGTEQTKTLGLNKSIIINGQRVSMVDAKPWIELIMYKTPGVYQVYFGFALALIGLAIYYGMPYQRITVTLSKEGELSIYYYAKMKSEAQEHRVEKVLEEVAQIISGELVNLQRREEGVW